MEMSSTRVNKSSVCNKEVTKAIRFTYQYPGLRSVDVAQHHYSYCIMH